MLYKKKKQRRQQKQKKKKKIYILNKQKKLKPQTKNKKKKKKKKKIRKINQKKHTNINKNEMLGLINIDTITDFGAAIQQRRKSRYDFGEQKIQKKKKQSKQSKLLGINELANHQPGFRRQTTAFKITRNIKDRD
eukprot:73914_1